MLSSDFSESLACYHAANFMGAWMEKKYWEIVGYWAIALLMLIATVIVIHWAMGFVTWSGLDSGWAQAIGSVAAILASFFLFQRQRKHEQQQARDDELARRTQAITTIQDVTYWSLEAITQCIKQKNGELGTVTPSQLTPRLDELRDMFNRFVDPSADRIIVAAALFFGNALLETKNDLAWEFLDRDVDGISRITIRRSLLSLTHDQLVRMQVALENACAARGIQLEPPETFSTTSSDKDG